MKKLLVVLGVICGLTITGSVSAYFLYLAPSFQEKQLAFEQMKWTQEQETKKKEAAKKTLEEIFKNVDKSKIKLNTPNCKQYVDIAKARFEDGSGKKIYFGTGYSEKFSKCISVYFFIDNGEIERGAFTPFDEEKREFILYQYIRRESFYGDDIWKDAYRILN